MLARYHGYLRPALALNVDQIGPPLLSRRHLSYRFVPNSFGPLTHPLVLVFLDDILFLLCGGSLRPLEIVQGLGEVGLKALPLQLPLPGDKEEVMVGKDGSGCLQPWIECLLRRVAIELLELLAGVLGQLSGVVLDLVPEWKVQAAAGCGVINIQLVL